ncbi:hypothetical protein H2200_010198 [Cladophialophora chaetospira]|uniref:Uncharacterized protein n=1 Tax=Cladophialophora chaetospira TaxID=386627 RepID=A0AA39CEQ4_9EURO|nr:hypothetical protein H2200_010198 [Cladophialophora chaetospira]
MSSSAPTEGKRGRKGISKDVLEKAARESAEKNGRLPSGSGRRQVFGVAYRRIKPKDGAGGQTSAPGSGTGIAGGGQSDELEIVAHNPQEMEPNELETLVHNRPPEKKPRLIRAMVMGSKKPRNGAGGRTSTPGSNTGIAGGAQAERLETPVQNRPQGMEHSDQHPPIVNSTSVDAVTSSGPEDTAPVLPNRGPIRAVVMYTKKPRDGADGRKGTRGTGVADGGHSNEHGTPVFNRTQEVVHIDQHPGFVDSTSVDAVASIDHDGAAAVHAEVGVGSGRFARITSDANMTPSPLPGPLEEAIIPQSSPLGYDSADEHLGAFTQDDDDDDDEGFLPEPEGYDGDTEEEEPQQTDAETASNVKAKKSVKEKSRWEEKYVLSGFPHPSVDPPPEEELSSLCKTHPNHLIKSRLDPFIQWDWTEKMILDNMDEKTVKRMEAGETAGCKNMLGTLSRRLRSRRWELGREGIVNLRAAAPMHPAHKRGKSNQSGMLDEENYAARVEAREKRKQGKKDARAKAKLAKEQQEISHRDETNQASAPTEKVHEEPDVSQIGADRIENSATPARANEWFFSTNPADFDRAEQMIQHLRGIRGTDVRPRTDTARPTLPPTIMKRTPTSDVEKEIPMKRARLEIEPSKHDEAGQTLTTRPPPIRVPGSENFSPLYLQENNIMPPASSVRKYLMPETAAERRTLMETTPNLTKRRTWNRAWGCWEFEVLDENQDVVDEYLEKR